MSYSQEELQNLIMAGKLAHKALDIVVKKLEPGLSIGALYDYIVKLITQKEGVDLAFPPNISVNEVAAHDTASINEKRKLKKNDLVTIDIGVNVEGMLSDTARTVSIAGRHALLIKASQEALQNAIDIVKPNVKPNEIGRVVQRTIEYYGFKPIANLTVHKLAKGNLNAGFSIPNIDSKMGVMSSKRIKAGMILAIEPFATNGKAGYIKDRGQPLIFSAKGKPKSKIGLLLYERFGMLPFALRTAAQYLETKKLTVPDLRMVLQKDHFHGYHPLVEASGGMVSQAEHSVIVTKNGCRVLT
ncbi:MAG: type II methionyl aminopeptidase [Candidatus Hermodarchaeota archaeon]